jgi:hypothetical protein
MQTLCFSTDATPARDRTALIRDVASAYFNLNVDLQAQAPESVFAEIAVSRTEAAARIMSTPRGAWWARLRRPGAATTTS